MADENVKEGDDPFDAARKALYSAASGFEAAVEYGDRIDEGPIVTIGGQRYFPASALSGALRRMAERYA